MTMTRKFGLSAAALGCALAVSPAAHASFLDMVLTGGTANVFEDNSREAFVDMDNSGTISTGDVVLGFVNIDLKSAPNNQNFNNQIYAIFSQQFGPIAGPIQTFVPTTVPGLRLSDIVGGAPANGMVAVYTSQAGLPDLIVSNNGNTDIFGYFDDIKTGTLELIAGFGKADDFFTSIASLPVTADDTPNFGILDITGGDTVANSSAGLSILVDNVANFDFATAVTIFNPATGLVGNYDLSISAAATSGGSDDPFFSSFGNVPGFNQCQTLANPTGPSLPCGFRDNADFELIPTAVPEPGSLALLGLGLLGLVSLKRRIGVR